MKSTIKRSTAVILMIVFFVVGIRVGTNMRVSPLSLNGVTHTASGTLLSDPQHQADLSLLWATWQRLQQSYIAPNDLISEKLLQSAAAGLVRGVGDPYTVYLTKAENKEFDETLNGKLEGIGAQLDLRDGLVIITHPLKGSPAEKAGILPNDVLATVDKQDVTGWTLDQVVSHVRGPKGTAVVITIVRKNEPKLLSFTITREEIRIPSVETRTEKTASGSIGYIALHQFGETSITEVDAAVEQFKKDKVAGIILDLRGNGGGYLDGAVGIASLFLQQGVVVSVERRGAEPIVHKVSGNVVAPDLRLVILIDGGSASASEILAGALQDHHRATIVGQKSFGKGTVQEIYPLPGGDSVKVTVARWITPNGKNLGKEGVHPDLNVEFTSADLQAKKDVQLEAAERAIFRK